MEKTLPFPIHLCRSGGESWKGKRGGEEKAATGRGKRTETRDKDRGGSRGRVERERE